MAPKVRVVGTGMVLLAALLGAMLAWRARSVASPLATATGLAEGASAHETTPSAALAPSAKVDASPSQGRVRRAHAPDETRTMESFAMPANDLLLPPPSVARLREEVTANPHMPPPCVMQFAAGWAAQMQAAKSDEQLADRLVTQAEAWVGERQQVVPVIQAICLSNTRLLAAAHQTLAQRYQAMRQRAGADVLRLAEATYAQR